MSDQNLNDQSLVSKLARLPVTERKMAFWLMTKAPQFTIGSMLILTTVVAAFSVSLSYYVRALWADGSLEWLGWKPPASDKVTGTEVGMFAIVSAMVPTVFLVVASWFLKVASFVAKFLK